MLYTALTHLGFTWEDYTLVDDLDGSEPRIANWSSTMPKPTQSEINAAYVEATQPDILLLSHATEVIGEWDIFINSIRARYITITSGQQEIYQAKYNQALAYKDAGYPADASLYFYIQLDAVAYSITHQQAADGIITKHDEWEAVSFSLEQMRLLTKVAIRNAGTIDEVDSIFESAESDVNVAFNP